LSRAGIVLCGGRSSRMGRSKAWLPWRGVPLLRFVVGVLTEAADEVLVVAAPDLDIPSVPARRIDDRQPGLGPLAGIREGLCEMKSASAYITGTDAPWLSADVVQHLLAYDEPVAPVTDGVVQTLAAVYPKRGAEIAADLLARGRRRPLDLLEALDYRRLDPFELPDGFAPETLNTPAEYLRAVRHNEPSATATLEFLGRARLILGERQREVPIGTLGELLRHTEPKLDLLPNGVLTREFRVTLDGHDFVQDPATPIGPGERVVVIDASVGG